MYWCYNWTQQTEWHISTGLSYELEPGIPPPISLNTTYIVAQDSHELEPVLPPPISLSTSWLYHFITIINLCSMFIPRILIWLTVYTHYHIQISLTRVPGTKRTKTYLEVLLWSRPGPWGSPSCAAVVKFFVLGVSKKGKFEAMCLCFYGNVCARWRTCEWWVT